MNLYQLYFKNKTIFVINKQILIFFSVNHTNVWILISFFYHTYRIFRIWIIQYFVRIQFFAMPYTVYHTYEVHYKIIFPGSWVSDFTGNLRAQKINKTQTNWANVTCVQYFSAYQQGVVSSNSSFIIYHLSSLYRPHNFVPKFNFSPPPPSTEHNAPLARVGLQFCTTTSPPDRQKGLPN